MTPDDLARVADIRARADAATDGPWTFYLDDLWHGATAEELTEADAAEVWEDSVVANRPHDSWGHLFHGDCKRPEDAEFIAAARADVPWLLDRLAAETERADVAEAAVSEAFSRGFVAASTGLAGSMRRD